MNLGFGFRQVLYFLAIVLSSILFVSPSLAEIPVGYVESKRGKSPSELWIIRKGKKVTSTAGTPLYPGDIIRVTGKKKHMILRFSGVKGAKILRSQQTFTVPKASKSSWGKWASDKLKSISWAIGFTDRREVRNMTARDELEGSLLLSKLKVLDTEKIYLVEGMGPVTVRWCGDAGELKWSKGDQTVSTAAKNRKFGEATFPHLVSDIMGNPLDRSDRFTLSPPGLPEDQREIARSLKEMSYEIEWKTQSEVPRPDGIPEPSNLTAEQKTQWAIWLINRSTETGELGFNLFAINQLLAARDEFWLSGYLLDQVTVCNGMQLRPTVPS